MNSALYITLVSGLWILVSQVSHAVVDANSNGLSDVWEKSFNSNQLFPNTANFFPLADPDGDSWTNEQESRAGTNPFSGKPPLGFLQLQITTVPAVYVNSPDNNGAPTLLSPATFTAQWPTLPGKQYTLLASPDLSPGSWMPVGIPITGQGTPLQIAIVPTYEDGSTPDKLFWRVAVNDLDSDGDGLTDAEEFTLGTDPNSIDTDLDGLLDGIDPLPLASATLADPDGSNLPASIATGLRAYWTFESNVVTAGKAVFPDESVNDYKATSAWAVPENDGMPSKAARIGPGNLVASSKSIPSNSDYTVSGWFQLAAGSINSGNTNYHVLYALYDRAGTGPAPQLAPIGRGTIVAVRYTPQGEQWFIGGYKQDAYYNQPPNSNGNAYTFLNGHGFTQPLGTTDDAKWHHFAVTRSTSAFGQKLYLDGVAVIQEPLLEYGVANDSDTTLTFGQLYPGWTPTGFPDAKIDRVRIHSRLLNQTEITALHQQDIDRDGSWDVTEVATRFWRDKNANYSIDPGEQQFNSSPFIWQSPSTDSDDDGLSNIQEQALGTDPFNPDSDGDRMPDGWEITNNLNPKVPNAGADHDNDGLSNLDEYRYNTNPNVADSDHDGKTDGQEVAQDSDPNDSSDLGQATAPVQKLSILLGIGDQSGSHSEDYVLNCYRLDSQTGQEVRVFTHISGGFGQYQEVTKSLFKKGVSYTFQIDWQATNLQVKPASPGSPAEGPDFDYTFKVQPQGTLANALLIPSYDIKAHQVSSTTLLAVDASNVAETSQEFKKNYESLRAAVVSPKLEWQAVDGYANLDTHTDPWTNTAKGKRIFPDYKDPASHQLRNFVQLVASGVLPGMPIYVKAYDVDDSTSETFDVDENGTSPVIDIYGKAGDDNLTDYLNTAKNGHFWTNNAWGSNTLQKPADSNGQAKFIFRVGMQPGNNYRVVASVNNESMYAGVQTANSTAAKYLGPELSQDGGAPASPPLTVWRKLWVENDSMKKIPKDEFLNKRNDLNSELTSPTILSIDPPNIPFQPPIPASTVLEINYIDDTTNFEHFENGYIKIGGEKYAVNATYSIPPGINQAGESYIAIGQNHIQIQTGMGYRLYDDDDYRLSRDALPRLDLIDDTIIDVYKKSFILVSDASQWNDVKEIDFYRNASELVGALRLNYGVWDDGLDPDLVGSENLWCATIIAGYQGNVNEDGDPASEGPATEGITPVRKVGGSPYSGDEARFSIVWVENVRDVLDSSLRGQTPVAQSEIDRKIRLTAAHEIGHMPHYLLGEEHHAEQGLMVEGGDTSIGSPGPYSEFSAKSIKRFRSIYKWRQE